MNILHELTVCEETLGTKSFSPLVFSAYQLKEALDDLDKRLKDGIITPDHHAKLMAKLKEEADAAHATTAYLLKLMGRTPDDAALDTSGVTVFHRMTKADILKQANRIENIPLLNLKPYDLKELEGVPEDTMVPGIYDYQIKGFFKAAAAALKIMDEADTESRKLTNYKANIDRLIFVRPRFIPLILPAGAQMGACERPIRVETAQGPRVSLVRSEAAPAGTKLHFEVISLTKFVGKDAEAGGKGSVDVEKMIAEWFGYGAFSGLGQWRNSSKGIFTCERVGAVNYQMPPKKAAKKDEPEATPA